MNRVRRSILVALPVAALLAACGSGTTTGTGTSSTPDTVQKATGTPIKVGYVRTQSGPLAGFISVGDQIQAGMEGYLGWLNEHGGINNHPVQLVDADDAGDPNTGLTAAKRLVEQDGVVAMLTVSGGSISAVNPYLESKQIPVLGTLAPILKTFMPPHPYIFGTQTPYEYQGAGVAEYLYSKGKRNVAYAGYSTISGQLFGKGFVERFKELGGTIALQDSFKQPSSDFAAMVQRLQNAKPDAVVWFSSDQEAAAVLKQSQDFGFQTTWVWGPGATTPHLTTLIGPLAEGTFGVSPFAATTSNSSASQEFKQNVTKYSTVKAAISSYTQFGYLDARAAADAMKAVKGDVTSPGIRDAAEALSGDYGLMPKFTLSATNHLMNTSVQIVQFKGADLQAASSFITPTLPKSLAAS
jgi:branched-chain amino acid transport system substrate-binding protein